MILLLLLLLILFIYYQDNQEDYKICATTFEKKIKHKYFYINNCIVSIVQMIEYPNNVVNEQHNMVTRDLAAEISIIAFSKKYLSRL